MDVLEEHFKSLDFQDAIQKEKDIVKATKVTDWREPVGTVAILSENWSSSTLLVMLMIRSLASCGVAARRSNLCWKLRRPRR
jgi:hypothetical protein